MEACAATNEGFASNSAADGCCFALPSCIPRDLATPSVAIGDHAAHANRGFTGQGPMASAIDASRSGPPEGMRAQELRPNPIRSDTSCRGIAAATTSKPDVAISRRETPTLSAIPPRAASPVLPRRRPRSAAPEVPSIDEPVSTFVPKHGVPEHARQLRRSVTVRGGESALEGPTLTGDPEFSTACHQDVENTGALTAIQRLLHSRTIRCP